MKLYLSRANETIDCANANETLLCSANKPNTTPYRCYMAEPEDCIYLSIPVHAEACIGGALNNYYYCHAPPMGPVYGGGGANPTLIYWGCER